jgi:hypothetical protein
VRRRAECTPRAPCPFERAARRLRLRRPANRIAAARACREFPVVLEHLASGRLSPAAVRLLAPHLTLANHVSVLERAAGRTRREIEVVVAHLAPRPDAPTVIRRLPAVTPVSRTPPTPQMSGSLALDPPAGGTDAASSSVAVSAAPVPPAPVRSAPPPRVQPTAPGRYRVQCTLGEEGHGRLRRLQALLRREIPDGDPGAIVDRALILLLERVEARKLGLTKRPRPIRPGADRVTEDRIDAADDIRPPPPDCRLHARTPPKWPRTVSLSVRRVVWHRREHARACVPVGAPAGIARAERPARSPALPPGPTPRPAAPPPVSAPRPAPP